MAQLAVVNPLKFHLQLLAVFVKLDQRQENTVFRRDVVHWVRDYSVASFLMNKKKAITFDHFKRRIEKLMRMGVRIDQYFI